MVGAADQCTNQEFPGLRLGLVCSFWKVMIWSVCSEVCTELSCWLHPLLGPVTQNLFSCGGSRRCEAADKGKLYYGHHLQSGTKACQP